MSVARRAFSMVEVIVASVIFAGTVAAVFATMAKTAAPVNISDSRVKAALFGKKILDGLNKNVSSNSLKASGLSVGMHGAFTDEDFPGYSANYVVSEDGGLRKVVVNVTWSAL